MGTGNCGQLMVLTMKGSLNMIRRTGKVQLRFHRARNILDCLKTINNMEMESSLMKLENQENVDFKMEIEQLGSIKY